MRWSVGASVLLGTRDDFIYRFLFERKIEAESAGAAIAALLQETEKREGRPVLGLWELQAAHAAEDDNA